ncbi:hypothetical protein LTS08_001346 [Lithohypha guttulata]|uniref:uncharacterized protein n=1 Tax=Lithohypha guttulata TaxID=1690604 RepID=UPI002DDF80CE|nr:hypothetical protein LTR51_003988 [Lithohypha guttulata]KAK5105072.1 hypothetical protein LTS08_001346 [Lithohypha guttulata]
MNSIFADTTTTDTTPNNLDMDDLTKALEDIELEQAWADRENVAATIPDARTSTRCDVSAESVVMPSSLDEHATQAMTQQFWDRNRRMREARVQAESAALIEQLRHSLSKAGLASINRSCSVSPQDYREADQHTMSKPALLAAQARETSGPARRPDYYEPQREVFPDVMNRTSTQKSEQQLCVSGGNNNRQDSKHAIFHHFNLGAYVRVRKGRYKGYTGRVEGRGMWSVAINLEVAARSVNVANQDLVLVQEEEEDKENQMDVE